MSPNGQFSFNSPAHTEKRTEKDKKKIRYFLNKWMKGYAGFNKLKSNTKLEKLRPLYKKLNSVAKQLLEAMDSKSKKSPN